MGTWPDFLRHERKRLIESLVVLERGTVKISRNESGVITDMTPEIIETDKRNIAEIEQLLSDAGEPLE